MTEPTQVSRRTVIAYTQLDPGGQMTRRHGVGICYAPEELHPYVVWTLVRLDDGEWFAESGDYFTDIAGAVAQYKRRGGK